jgi:hypothetical protein
MPVPHHLSRTFQDTLGTEASDAMTDWMNEVDAQHAEVRQEIAELRRDVRAEDDGVLGGFPGHDGWRAGRPCSNAALIGASEEGWSFPRKAKTAKTPKTAEQAVFPRFPMEKRAS